MTNGMHVEDHVKFEPKARAVPYNYRISYKVSQICLILQICCRRGGCSQIKLQLLSTCLLSKSEHDKLIKICNNDASFMMPIIRFDPAVSRALQFALADGFVYRLINGTIKLTEKGQRFTESILSDDSLMKLEVNRLNEIGGKLTADKLKVIAEQLEVASNAESK